jgi:hypothetical protein
MRDAMRDVRTGCVEDWIHEDWVYEDWVYEDWVYEDWVCRGLDT